MNYIEKAIENRNGKETPEGVCYVTELVKCPLKAYLHRLEPEEYDDEVMRKFKAGDMLEDGFTTILRKDPDIYIIGTQWRAYYKDDKVEVHGRVDILAQHDNHNIVAHEVKSTQSHPWKGEAHSHHVEQLQFYLNALGVENGEVNYISKKAMLTGKDQIDTAYPIKRDPTVYEKLIRRAHLLITAVQFNIPPSPDPKTDWECNYCCHKPTCPKHHEDTP